MLISVSVHTNILLMSKGVLPAIPECVIMYKIILEEPLTRVWGVCYDWTRHLVYILSSQFLGIVRLILGGWH